MIRSRINGSAKAKLAALAVVGACFATVAPASALALNPQPLPPRAGEPSLLVNPPILIGGLTCHEYGCL
jgi:hypothetical protein